MILSLLLSLLIAIPLAIFLQEKGTIKLHMDANFTNRRMFGVIYHEVAARVVDDQLQRFVYLTHNYLSLGKKTGHISLHFNNIN